jgi:hypothetical protein
MAKKMVMPFFDQQGVIFTNCVLLVITVHAAYIVLGISMKWLTQKRVVAAAAGQWFLRWNNGPIAQWHLCVQVASGAQHPGALSPSLLTKYNICRLCSFPKGERSPGWRHPETRTPWKAPWNGPSGLLTQKSSPPPTADS